jgi:hypothetical protein
MVDYKKKYLKYKKKYLQIKKLKGGADQIYDRVKNFLLRNETREEALRNEAIKRQNERGVAVGDANKDIEQAQKGIVNLTILEKIKKEEEQKKDIKPPAVQKWSHLAKKSENVFNNIEDCQKEVERLQELLKKKEIGGEELTPSTKK